MALTKISPDAIDLKTIGGTSIEGTGDVAFKTIGGTSVLGSGNITLGGITNVVTATGNTTLTSTPTLLKITPASYGVTVTLPDATTCSVGGPLHIIDNRGAYPVRVCDSTGVLKGFIFAGVVSHISLSDISTAAGVWAIENNELVGASAQLLTTNMARIDAVIDIGSSQEVIVGRGVANANCYGVVYNRATNTFGSVTLIRTATIPNVAAVLSGANQVLVVSCTATTAFEAVALSISGTTITVNTAATATLSANIYRFADGCGLIAVGSSFVTSYRVYTPAVQIRALSISGTTVTIGSASVLSGTDIIGGLIAASGSIVLAASSTSGTLYCAPYTVSGSTLTIGTEASRVQAVSSIKKFAPLGANWALISSTATNGVHGTICSLSATTVTMSTVADMLGTGILADAIIVGSNKVLVLGAHTADNANILTDTAGTASTGASITLSSLTSRACLYADGTNVYIADGATNENAYKILKIDCSGASPVLSESQVISTSASYASLNQVSNAVLQVSADLVVGSAFVANSAIIPGSSTTLMVQVNKGRVARKISENYCSGVSPLTNYRGAVPSARWTTNTATVIAKLECVA